MKKIQSISLTIVLIGLMTPSAAVYAQNQESVASPEIPVVSIKQPTSDIPSTSRWTRATALVKEKLPTRKSLQNLLPMLRDKSKQAASFLQQKSYCLFKYDNCTKRDKLLISNTFGFMAGYGIQYRSVFSRIFEYFGVKSSLLEVTMPGSRTRIPIITLTDILVLITGLTGPLFIGRGAGTTLPIWIKGYVEARNKATYLGTQGAFIANDKLLMLILAIDAISIVQEIAFAFQYSGSVSPRNIARYLKMNMQCIWSETYCKPKQNAESRRTGLYFWLGFLEGMIARTVMKPITPRRVSRPPSVPRSIYDLYRGARSLGDGL